MSGQHAFAMIATPSTSPFAVPRVRRSADSQNRSLVCNQRLRVGLPSIIGKLEIPEGTSISQNWDHNVQITPLKAAC
jgi:hypothetical protein